MTGDGSEQESWARVEEILTAVNGRWAIHILRHLATGVSRPADLLAAINTTATTTLSRKILFEAIGRLLSLGLITRSVISQPRQTHYALTSEGHRIVTELARLGAPDGQPAAAPEAAGEEIDFDPVRADRPSPARVWNVLLGGKDNFEADRAAARTIVGVLPSLPVIARAVRRFQAEAVRRLVQLGVRQFLDLGTGLPVAGAVHEVAQRIAPESRVVYVDNDPLVLAHARALLVSDSRGACDYVHADIRQPEMILAAAARTLDLAQPAAVLFIGVLNFILDEDDPYGLTARFMTGLSGPGYLVIVHAASDIQAAQIKDMTAKYNAFSAVPFLPRPRAAVSRFFDGMDLIGPGLIPLADWFPPAAGGTAEADLASWAAIGVQRATRASGGRPGRD